MRHRGLGLIIAGLVLAGCTADRPALPARRRVQPSPVRRPCATSAATRAPRPRRRRAPPAHADPDPHRREAPAEAEPDLGAGADREEVRRPRAAARAAVRKHRDYRRYLVSYRGDGLRIYRGDERARRARGRSRCWCSTTATSTPTSTSPARASRGSRTTSLDGASSCCTSTTATTPDRQRPGRRLRAPPGLRGRHDQRGQGGEGLEAPLPGQRPGRLDGPVHGRGRDLNALAAQPGLVDAAVVYATTSSLAADNWRQFSRDGDDQRTNRRIGRTYGLPDDNPKFWPAASPGRTWAGSPMPVLMHHGTEDDTCPLGWARSSPRP